MTRRIKGEPTKAELRTLFGLGPNEPLPEIRDATRPLRFHLTREIVEEAHRLHLTGYQTMALALVRPTAPEAPVVVRSKLGSAKFKNGVIQIG
jgi:hypothetical protein